MLVMLNCVNNAQGFCGGTRVVNNGRLVVQLVGGRRAEGAAPFDAGGPFFYRFLLSHSPHMTTNSSAH